MSTGVYGRLLLSASFSSFLLIFQISHEGIPWRSYSALWSGKPDVSLDTIEVSSSDAILQSRSSRQCGVQYEGPCRLGEVGTEGGVSLSSALYVADCRASVICSLGTEAQPWKKSRQLSLLLSAISYSDVEYVDLYLYTYLFLFDHACLILSVFPGVRKVLGPVSTCRPLLHIPEGVSGCTVCLSGWTGTCYVPREDWSKTLILIIYVILMHRYILEALSWQKCCSLSEQGECEMLVNIFSQ
jgi:hypothetical protein